MAVEVGKRVGTHPTGTRDHTDESTPEQAADRSPESFNVQESRHPSHAYFPFAATRLDLEHFQG
jgi:hypothetical protein